MIVGLRRNVFGALDFSLYTTAAPPAGAAQTAPAPTLSSTTVANLLHQAALSSFTAPAPPSSPFMAPPPPPAPALPPGWRPQNQAAAAQAAPQATWSGTPTIFNTQTGQVVSPPPRSLTPLETSQAAAAADTSSTSNMLLWGGGIAALFAVGFLMFGRRAAA